MADSNDGSIAPRRSLGGPILPPPPPELAEDARKAEEDKAAAERAEALREEDKQAHAAEKQARESARQQEAAEREAEKRAQKEAAEAGGPAGQGGEAGQGPPNRPRPRKAPAPATATAGGPRRTRRAQLRLVQVDAWSVMKTSFLLSIALGIVLVVAVAIIMGVLGAAGVWDSINSIVKQAVGGDGGSQFDIEQYVGTSRIIGFTMIVAVIDVILITAIATLGAFLYNLAAALLGGIEVTLAEDS